MSLRELVKHYLKIVGHVDHTDHALDLIIDQNNRMARAQTALLESSIHTVHALNRAQADLNALKRRVAELTALKDTVEEQMVRQISVETDDYGFTNPETGLISFLYSFLPSPRALDIGAHAGDVSARMLETGYEVYAFEPYPPVYEKLAARLPCPGPFRIRAVRRRHRLQQPPSPFHAGRPPLHRDGRGHRQDAGRPAQRRHPA